MWEPTGRKATDRTTGAKLIEERFAHSPKGNGSVRWAVYANDVLLGHVHSYEGHRDYGLANSRVVTRRVTKTMWASQAVRRAGMPRQRAWYGHATRARAVYALIKY